MKYVKASAQARLEISMQTGELKAKINALLDSYKRTQNGAYVLNAVRLVKKEAPVYRTYKFKEHELKGGEFIQYSMTLNTRLQGGANLSVEDYANFYALCSNEGVDLSKYGLDHNTA